jgi:NADH:ubiquinone oxidoreductase subunit E
MPASALAVLDAVSTSAGCFYVEPESKHTLAFFVQLPAASVSDAPQFANFFAEAVAAAYRRDRVLVYCLQSNCQA